MQRLIKSIASGLGIVATVATVVMMLSISADVFYRVFYRKSLAGLLEISETALVAAVFLGMAYTALTNSHVSVDLLTVRVKPKLARIFVLISWILVVVIVGWMVYATVLRAMHSTEEGEVRMGLIAWPLYPTRWIIVVGLVTMLIVALANVYRLVRGKPVFGDVPFEKQDPDLLYAKAGGYDDGFESTEATTTTTGEGAKS
ncbi:MAG: TRAP transporter small permease [Actinomycetaceae bacterium]|nr:TRAP transporter small permease [Actinomycetaceae bacterium]